MKNPYGAEYDHMLPFDQCGLTIPGWRELPIPDVPAKVQITVGIPLYKNVEALEGCVESIVKQRFPKEAYEIIIVCEPGDEDNWEEAERMVERYPEHNIIAYDRRDAPHHGNPSKAFNVAIRQGRGWIFISNQHHMYWNTTEYLRIVWIHHNARKNIYLVPNTFCEHPNGYLELREHPHEWGSSMRMEHLHKIHGYDEAILGQPSDVCLFCRLTRIGVVYVRDDEFQNIHRPYSSLGSFPMPEGTGYAWNPDDYVKNKNGKWGLAEGLTMMMIKK